MSRTEYLIFNGQFLPANEPVIHVDNRAFMYGDGLFETIRVIDGVPRFFNDHYNRLIEGMRALKLNIPPYFTQERLEENARLLIDKNQLTGGARLRLTVFRNPGGFYLPTQNEMSYTLVLKPVENNFYLLNEQGLSIDVYTDIKKPIHFLSNYKTLNSQLFVMAGLAAKERQMDDMLVLNEKGNVIETTSSNLFLVSNGVLYTPSLDEGCLAGVMRMQIINLAIMLKFKVYECALTPQRLLGADEVFITNTAKGIQWVNKYRAKRFYHKYSDYLLTQLNSSILNLDSDLPENSQGLQTPSQDFLGYSPKNDPREHS